MPIPYRLDFLLAPSPEEVQEINTTNNFSGSRAYEGRDKAIDRAATAKNAILDRVRSLAYHPDEEVTYNLLQNASVLGDRGYPNKVGLLALPAIYQRALASANSEGVFWNPLLDGLGSFRKWQIDTQQRSYHYYSYTSPTPRTPTMGDYLAPIETVQNGGIAKALSAPDLAEFLEPLGNWIGAQNSPQDVLPLLKFRTNEVRRLVAARTRGLTDVDIRKLLRDPDPEMSKFLASNPHLTTDQYERIGKHVLACVVRVSLGRLGTPTGKRAVKRMHQGPATIKALHEKNTKFHYRAMRRAALAQPKVSSAVNTNSTDPDVSSFQIPYDTLNIITALDTSLPPDVLKETIQNFKGYSAHLVQLIEHPAMNEEVLIATAQKHRLFSARMAIARSAGRIKSQALREELSKSTSPAIAGALVAGEPKPRRHKSLLRKALKNPEGQDEILKSLLDFKNYVCLDQLTPEMLEPIYTLPPESPDVPGPYSYIHARRNEASLPRILTALQTLAAFRRISRHFKDQPDAPSLALLGEKLFADKFPALHDRYLRVYKKSKANAYYSGPRPSDAEIELQAEAEVLKKLPELADTLSMDVIKLMMKSTDKEIRMTAIKSLPFIKRDKATEEPGEESSTDKTQKHKPKPLL